MHDLFFQSLPTLEDTYPLEQWQPQTWRDIDIRIDSQGNWWHEGARIERLRLVQLFAQLLCVDAGAYFLKTPEVCWRIQVDTYPFLGVRWEADGAHWRLHTSVGYCVTLGAQTPLFLPQGEQVPVVVIREGLCATLSRSAHYELAEMGQWCGETLELRSGSCVFSLAF